MEPARTTFARERCARWDEVHRHYFPDYDERWRAVIDAVRAAAPATPRVLDLGCGPGTLTARLAAALDRARVLGVDLDPLLVALAREARTHDSPEFLGLDLLAPDAAQVLGGLGPFDAIVSSAFMHYFAPRRLAELHRLCASLLAPGGILVTAERFAEPGAASAPSDSPPSEDVDPWGAWWQCTRAEAPQHGFTVSPADSADTADAAEDPPPLGLAAYRQALGAAGLAVRRIAEHSGGSTVVVAGAPGDGRDETLRVSPGGP